MGLCIVGLLHGLEEGHMIRPNESKNIGITDYTFTALNNRSMHENGQSFKMRSKKKNLLRTSED